MYQAHFGLEKSLFEGGIAQDAAIFFGARRQLVTANFKVALTTFDSAVILSGPAGIGKTTLASTAVRAISTRVALGWLSTVPANAAELLEFLLVEFGFNAHRVGRVERLQMWRQFLNEMNATESRVFVIVENAEDLAPEVLRALESLTAADPTGCRGANLVLLGRTGLDEHLRSPLLESLRQRVRLRQKLEPFTAEELQDYLRHQVTHAGGVFERVFGAGTVAALHQYSGGIARIANNLCETALTLAATSQEPELTPELVGKVAVGLFGLDAGESSRMEPPPSEPAGREPSAATVPVVNNPIPAATGPIPEASLPSPARPADTIAPPEDAARSPAFATPAATATAAAPPARPAAPVLPAAAAAAAVPAARAAAPTAVPPPTAPVVTIAPSHAEATPLTTAPAAETAPSPARADDSPAGYEFDGAATDTPDVAMADFPVLTDAVEMASDEPEPVLAPAPIAAPARRPESAPLRSPALTPAGARAYAPAPPPAATPAAVPRANTARAPSPTPAPVVAPEPAARHKEPPRPAAAAPATAAKATSDALDEEQLHQTQTMRALSVAKSIDDISSSMAETLFGDADLEMLSAALASAGWSETDTATATESAPAPKAATPQAARPAPNEDPFAFFDLSPGAPLELLDDSKTPGADSARKVATKR